MMNLMIEAVVLSFSMGAIMGAIVALHLSHASKKVSVEQPQTVLHPHGNK